MKTTAAWASGLNTDGRDQRSSMLGSELLTSWIRASWPRTRRGIVVPRKSLVSGAASSTGTDRQRELRPPRRRTPTDGRAGARRAAARDRLQCERGAQSDACNQPRSPANGDQHACETEEDRPVDVARVEREQHGIGQAESQQCDRTSRTAPAVAEKLQKDRSCDEDRREIDEKEESVRPREVESAERQQEA